MIYDDDKHIILRCADNLELKAKALRAACNGQPIQFAGSDKWYDTEPDYNLLTNPYCLFRIKPTDPTKDVGSLP